MNRHDLSTKLIHLLKGKTDEENLGTLKSILRAGTLLGNCECIKGGYHCVCLTEAPISSIGSILDHAAIRGFRYRPFGIIADKDWIFELGGRPAIYQPLEEYDLVPEILRYRHVTYDPTHPSRPIDFTWEREWRLSCEELELICDRVSILVPRRECIYEMRDFERDEETVCPWTYLALEDLGFTISPVEARR